MRATYYFEAHGVCPVNGEKDCYQVTVTSEHPIMAEKILEISDRILAEPVTQENYTDRLCRELNAEVHTRGTHSGVETTVECP